MRRIVYTGPFVSLRSERDWIMKAKSNGSSYATRSDIEKTTAKYTDSNNPIFDVDLSTYEELPFRTPYEGGLVTLSLFKLPLIYFGDCKASISPVTIPNNQREITIQNLVYCIETQKNQHPETFWSIGNKYFDTQFLSREFWNWKPLITFITKKPYVEKIRKAIMEENCILDDLTVTNFFAYDSSSSVFITDKGLLGPIGSPVLKKAKDDIKNTSDHLSKIQKLWEEAGAVEKGEFHTIQREIFEIINLEPAKRKFAKH